MTHILSRWLSFNPAKQHRSREQIVYSVRQTFSRKAQFETLEKRFAMTGQPPVAVADTYSVNEDGVRTVPQIEGVLINDTDAESDLLKSSIITETSHGVLLFGQNGSFIYTVPCQN
jgi:hypothetical protein